MLTFEELLGEALQHDPLRYSTFARHNGRTVVIQRYGEEFCLITSLTGKEEQVPTSELQAMPTHKPQRQTRRQPQSQLQPTPA